MQFLKAYHPPEKTDTISKKWMIELQEKKLRANLVKVMWMSFSNMFLVLMPVIIPFFQMHQLSMEDIYILQAVFAISVAILEVPSGYLADLIGRKKSLILAGLFRGGAFLVLVYSDTFQGFVGYEIGCAIAISLYSGTDVAMLYDSLENLNQPKNGEAHWMGRRLFYSQIGETMAALLGGALAVYSLTLPAIVNAITVWSLLGIALTLHEPERKRMCLQRHGENFRYIYNALFRHSRLLNLIILNLIFYGLATLLAVWAFQGYWRQMNVPLSCFGYLWAAYNLVVALTGRMAHRFQQGAGMILTVICIGVLPVIGYWGMSCFGALIGIGFGFAFQIGRGLTQVILRDALNTRITADMRATANSVTSLGVRIAFVFLGPLMGYLIDNQGYSMAFGCFGVFYGIGFLTLCLPLIYQLGKIQAEHKKNG